MKFAIVDGNKTEPQPKLKGVCPNCKSEMIAKCGKVKVWHWAHKSKLHCDHWWESETAWHREWKNYFPDDWQEVIHTDPKTGEKHFADVKNSFGLVIEFQHSAIKEEERISREDFYKPMVWVVDGCRNESDKYNFKIGLSGPIQKNPLAYQFKWYSRSRLFHNWCESKVKVFIDFGEDVLWRLVFFDPEKNQGVVGPLPKNFFIEDCSNVVDISIVELPEENEKKKNT